MDEQKIIFSNRFEKEKFEDYKTDLGTDSSVTPDFTEADDFLKFIQKNRRSVPSKERIADKDKFIKTVYELSNSLINKIHQDHNGMIWIATEDGLNRYDGVKLTVYRHQPVFEF